MLNIGCHLSSAKGYLHMGEEALALGANTFQFFTRNPRGGRAKAIDTEDIRALLALMRENSFAPLLAHAPYTLNACSADSKMRDFARMVMTEDLQLLELLPGTRYNFHPGSHVKQGAEQGIIMIAELLNEILRPQQQTMVLLETMAGKGSEVGRNFTELTGVQTCALPIWRLWLVKAVKLGETLRNCVRLSTEWSCRENWGYVWIPVMFLTAAMI